jgi:periplasmic copper chaperone A
MKRLLLVFATLAPVALAACGQSGGAAPQPSVASASDALCRPTPNGRQMTGCYLTVTTTGDDRLLSVTTPSASRVEIHESKIESGMMMMTELRNGLPLPAGQAVSLQPGGNHIMLLGVTDPLTAGETVTLTLNFATAKPVEIVAPVGQPPAAS